MCQRTIIVGRAEARVTYPRVYSTALPVGAPGTHHGADRERCQLPMKLHSCSPHHLEGILQLIQMIIFISAKPAQVRFMGFLQQACVDPALS